MEFKIKANVGDVIEFALSCPGEEFLITKVYDNNKYDLTCIKSNSRQGASYTGCYIESPDRNWGNYGTRIVRASSLENQYNRSVEDV